MLCFIHIERAGGTTLHHILRNNFLSFLTLKPSLWSNDPATILTARELRALLRVLPFTKGFGGHTTRAYAGYERVTSQPIRYFTFLRDPVDRYVSHFDYQVDSMDVPWTMESFIEEPRFANFMTTRVAGGADLDRAKELLQSRFSFVGLTERFDESLLLMRHALGLPQLDLRYERMNAGRGDGPEAGSTRKGSEVGGHVESAESLGRLRSQNTLDLALYEFVRDELYPQYVERYGSALSADLERFTADNDAFKFSPVRRYAWGLYRKLGYEPLQAGVRRWQGQRSHVVLSGAASG